MHQDPASKQSEILIFFFMEPGQNDPGHHASKICTFNMTLQPIEKVIFFLIQANVTSRITTVIKSTQKVGDESLQ